MTVKELIEALSQFPQDKQVLLWAQKGYIGYDEADYWSGPAEVNMIEEQPDAINKNLKGQIKLEYLTDEEANSEIRWRKYDSKKAQMYIHTKSGIKYNSITDDSCQENSENTEK
ncbi:MAG: hypothetical protein II670_10880 [Alphaproteobacteria bacterium]|nr:hypothetical protein [Alphaproteobacteria bacterium]